MKVLKQISFIFIFFLFFLSLLLGEEPSEHCKHAARVTNNIIRAVYNKYGFSVIGTGGGMMTDVERIHIHFSSKGKVRVEECREIFLDLLRIAQEEVNNDEGIRPFLHSYPFDQTNFRLDIVFQDNYVYPPEGYVAYVYNRDSLIYYNEYRTKEDSLETLEKEYHSEALLHKSLGKH